VPGPDSESRFNFKFGLTSAGSPQCRTGLRVTVQVEGWPDPGREPAAPGRDRTPSHGARCKFGFGPSVWGERSKIEKRVGTSRRVLQPATASASWGFGLAWRGAGGVAAGGPAGSGAAAGAGGKSGGSGRGADEGPRPLRWRARRAWV
jgi:hypothetical protein